MPIHMSPSQALKPKCAKGAEAWITKATKATTIQFLWTLSSLPKGWRLKWLKHSKTFQVHLSGIVCFSKKPEARTRSWALRRGSPYFRPYPLPGRSTRSLTALNAHTVKNLKCIQNMSGRTCTKGLHGCSIGFREDLHRCLRQVACFRNLDEAYRTCLRETSK